MCSFNIDYQHLKVKLNVTQRKKIIYKIDGSNFHSELIDFYIRSRKDSIR